MKRIILIRHAEAENSILVPDIDRDLSLKGIQQAEASTNFISQFPVDKILVSPTERAIQTLSIILKKSDVNDIDTLSEIYQGPLDDIEAIIFQQDNTVNSLLIIGHNPYIHQLAMGMIEPDSKQYESITGAVMSNAKVIVIDFNVADWQELSSVKGLIHSTFDPQATS